MRKILLFLLLSLWSLKSFGAVLLLSDKTTLTGSIVKWDQEEVRIKSGEEERSIPRARLVMLVFDTAKLKQIRDRLISVTEELDRFQKSKVSENPERFIGFMKDQQYSHIRNISPDELSRIVMDPLAFPEIEAVLVNDRYISLVELFPRRYHSGYHHHRWSGNLDVLLYVSYLDFTLNFPSVEYKEGTLFSENHKSDINGPYINLSAFSFAISGEYLGGGFKIFQYSRYNTSVKSWLPLSLWIPLYINPHRVKRSDLIFQAEWGYWPYGDYGRYLDLGLHYYLSFSDEYPLFPLKFSLGAAHLYKGEAKSWELYFSLTFALGAMGGL